MATIKDVIILSLLLVITACGGLLVWAGHDCRKLQEKIDEQAQEIIKLETMVKRDDVLLDQFMHGTWDRDCRYELVADELLADGSVRSGLIQHCGEGL